MNNVEYTTKSGRKTKRRIFSTSLRNDDEQKKQTYYHPILVKNYDTLKNTKCKCNKKKKIFFSKAGEIFLKCNSCKKKSFACLICSKCFTTSKSLRRHIEKIHDSSCCMFCKKILSGVMLLVVHMSGHVKKLEGKGIEYEEQFESFKSNEKDDLANEKDDPMNENDDLMNLDEINSGGDIVDDNNERDKERKNDEDEEEDEGEEEEDDEFQMEMEKILMEKLENRDLKEDYFPIRKHLDWEVDLRKEYCFFDVPQEDDIVIEPLKNFKDFGKFKTKSNLFIYKYASKVGISQQNLQELVNGMNDPSLIDSSKSFKSARTLHKHSKEIKGIESKTFLCEKGHVVKIIPIEEMLKKKFGEVEFLYSFHVDNEDVNENDRIDSFYKTKIFKKKVLEAVEKNSHVLCLGGYRDKYPGYNVADFSVKGYYYWFLNGSYPEILSQICQFCQGGLGDCCLEIIDREWIININRLFEKRILIKIPFFEHHVVFSFDYTIELQDSPEKSANTLSKDSGGELGCHTCKCNKDDYDNPDVERELKTLKDSKKFYEKYTNLLPLNVRGNKTKLASIEKKEGWTISKYKYNEDKKGNEKVYKERSSFYNLNEKLIETIIFPPEAFHSIVRGYINHLNDAIFGGCSEVQKRLMNEKLSKIEYPSKMRKPKSLNSLGSNFDVHYALLFVYGHLCIDIFPKRIVKAIKKNLKSITNCMTPLATMKNIEESEKCFAVTMRVLREQFNLNYPITCHIFHIFKYMKSMGPMFLWWGKKMEIFHMYFKRKMRNCFSKNPPVYLVEEYIKDQNLKLFPSTESNESKMYSYNESIKFTLYQKSINRKDIEEYIRKEYKLSNLTSIYTKDIKILKKYTKYYKNGENVLFTYQEKRIVVNISFMCLIQCIILGTEYPFPVIDQLIILVGKSDNCEKLLLMKEEQIEGKPFLNDKEVINTIL